MSALAGVDRPETVAGDAAAQVQQLLRQELRGRSPYGAPQLDVPVRLNTNENPHPPSPALVADLTASVADAATGANRYPDRDAVALREDLAAYLSASTGVALTGAQLWAANGSNEVLQQLMQAFGGPGRTVMGFGPTYSMYPLLAAGTGTRYLDAPVRDTRFGLEVERAVDAVRDADPDIVLLCSPNNPTGTAVPPDAVARLAQVTRGLLVVDEAYAEFGDAVSAATLLARRPRVVVSRTMSKAFAFAGGRLGYLAAAPEIVDAVQLVRLPYHLSAVSQAAARAALRHADDTLASVAEVRQQRERIVAALRAAGLEVIDSDANFVLFGRFASSAAVWQGLLDRGVLVRDVGLPGWLRVTAGTEHETTAFLEALPAARELGDTP